MIYFLRREGFSLEFPFTHASVFSLVENQMNKKASDWNYIIDSLIYVNYREEQIIDCNNSILLSVRLMMRGQNKNRWKWETSRKMGLNKGLKFNFHCLFIVRRQEWGKTWTGMRQRSDGKLIKKRARKVFSVAFYAQQLMSYERRSKFKLTTLVTRVFFISCHSQPLHLTDETFSRHLPFLGGCTAVEDLENCFFKWKTFAEQHPSDHKRSDFAG